MHLNGLSTCIRRPQKTPEDPRRPQKRYIRNSGIYRLQRQGRRSECSRTCMRSSGPPRPDLEKRHISKIVVGTIAEVRRWEAAGPACDHASCSIGFSESTARSSPVFTPYTAQRKSGWSTCWISREHNGCVATCGDAVEHRRVSARPGGML